MLMASFLAELSEAWRPSGKQTLSHVSGEELTVADSFTLPLG